MDNDNFNKYVSKLNKEVNILANYPNQIRGLLFGAHAYEKRILKNPTKCTCPKCNNDSIKNSHTISKKMSLELIQEDRQVYTPAFIKKFPVKTDIICMEKIEINEASTFPGFCFKHELLFSDFETNGIFDAKKHICKQTYRNLCRSIAVKKSEHKALQNLIKGYCELRNKMQERQHLNIILLIKL